MDTNETKPSWRDKVAGTQNGKDLPKLADQFGDTASSSRPAPGVFPPAKAPVSETSQGGETQVSGGNKPQNDGAEANDSEENSSEIGVNSEADKPTLAAPAPLPPAPSKPAGAAALPPPPPPPAKSTGPARGMPLPPPVPATAPTKTSTDLAAPAPIAGPAELPVEDEKPETPAFKADLADVAEETNADEEAVVAPVELPNPIGQAPVDAATVSDPISPDNEEDDGKAEEEPKPRVSSPQTFAERLRARREEAERAGRETPSEGAGRGLHLRPTEEPVEGAHQEVPEPVAAETVDEVEPNVAVEPETESGDVIADPPVFGKRGTEASVPAKPVIAARPTYDYSAAAAKPVAPPPPPPAGLASPGIAPPPSAPPQYAPPVASAHPTPPAAVAANVAPETPAAPASGYAPPQAGLNAPPAAPAAPVGAEQAYQQYYGYADDRFERAPEGYRSAHARELDYADEGAYGGQYMDRRATAADYEYAYNEYDDRYEEEPRSKLGPVLLLCGLLLVGGIAAGLIWYFLQKGGNSIAGGGAPPVVSASPSDVKVTPPNSGQPQAPKQTKLFYDRIVGEQTVEGERLVPREEQPLDPAQNAQPAGSQAQPPAQLPEGELPVPQLPPPLPGSSSSISPTGDTSVQQASAQSGKSSKTVVSPVAASGKQSLDTVRQETITEDTVTGSTTQQTAALSDPNASVSNVSPPPLPRVKPADVARAERAKAAQRAAAQTASASTQTVASTANQGGPLDLSPSNLSSPSAPIPPPEPTQQVASLQQTPPPAPVQQVQQPQPAPAAPSQPVSDGAYIVQLAAYKDEGSARAGYRDLQGRHPSMLGSYQPIINQTKVGSFGTFYRLQVGPIANSQSARQMCSTLLAAGEKDCTVKRR